MILPSVIKFKWDSFNKFILRLEQSSKPVQKLYHYYIEENIKSINDVIQFFNIFESNNITTFEIDTDNPFDMDLFNHTIKGFGKGELYCFLSLRESTLMGQNFDYDLTLESGDKIEIKAYLESNNVDIRLGVLASFTQSNIFSVLINIIHCIEHLDNIDHQLNWILEYKDKILKGEVSQKVIERIFEMFKYLNIISTVFKDIQKMETIEHKGKYFHLVEDNKTNLYYTGFKGASIPNDSYWMNKLLNLQYIEHPLDFWKDLNNIKTRYIEDNNINFLIFHNKDKIYYGNNPRHFKVKRISQNKIRLKLI